MYMQAKCLILSPTKPDQIIPLPITASPPVRRARADVGSATIVTDDDGDVMMVPVIPEAVVIRGSYLS